MAVTGAVPGTTSPSRPRAARRLVPAVAAVGAAAPALAYLWAVSPERPGHYPVCPLYWATGLYCPGCGTLRAAHALLHGDLSTALHRNVLVVLAVPVLVLLGLDRLVRLVRGRPARPLALSGPGTVVVVALLVAYGVVRNTAWGAFLAP